MESFRINTIGFLEGNSPPIKFLENPYKHAFRNPPRIFYDIVINILFGIASKISPMIPIHNLPVIFLAIPPEISSRIH